MAPLRHLRMMIHTYAVSLRSVNTDSERYACICINVSGFVWSIVYFVSITYVTLLQTQYLKPMIYTLLRICLNDCRHTCAKNTRVICFSFLNLRTLCLSTATFTSITGNTACVSPRDLLL